MSLVAILTNKQHTEQSVPRAHPFTPGMAEDFPMESEECGAVQAALCLC